MDTTVDEVCRGDNIDRARQDILNRTSLTFLPRRQTQFMSDYADLPGDWRMTVRDRIKLMPDDYRREFLGRVEAVVQHSTQAEQDKVSEFNWEADAWRDIFGRMRDDDRLRMWVQGKSMTIVESLIQRSLLFTGTNVNIITG